MILTLFTVSTVSMVDVQETSYGHIVKAEETTVNREVATNNTEAIVRSYFKDTPVMIQVARCESTFTHELADGSVLQGRVDPADTGVMQINKRYHEASAIKMGLNVDDIYDNMAYAQHLYDTQGVQPWSASRPCWGNALAANF